MFELSLSHYSLTSTIVLEWLSGDGVVMMENCWCCRYLQDFTFTFPDPWRWEASSRGFIGVPGRAGFQMFLLNSQPQTFRIIMEIFCTKYFYGNWKDSSTLNFTPHSRVPMALLKVENIWKYTQINLKGTQRNENNLHTHSNVLKIKKNLKEFYLRSFFSIIHLICLKMRELVEDCKSSSVCLDLTSSHSLQSQYLQLRFEITELLSNIWTCFL